MLETFAAIVFIVQVPSVTSTSEDGGSMPVLFQRTVAKPFGIETMSWWDPVIPGTEVLPVPSMPRETILPEPVFWTLRDIMYMCAPSQLRWDRLFWPGPVAHHTTSPSASTITVLEPVRPPLMMTNPLS